ncbi:tRNA (N6-threonylcarbamoyladenosine(37)-N6)-methyltransferase TrmO [Pseudidiomarina sp. YC-516-91]|uniref:tRNA (N6-threonylcarbamoyladenosine(37)-N6)-methyltransferase TrmO n=1 Tax=Pseudidiomarina salilacus TaxID=3384452 RepID=UPI0039850884
MQHNIEPIGYVRSPYKEKFAVPRQPGLVAAARCCIELHGDFAKPDTTRGLEQFSHVWVVFAFHENLTQGWQSLVRPPRLGGNEKLGVFATRSTFRPNGLGLSVAKLDRIEYDKHTTKIYVAGGDWVDGTPVFDIKPYIPYTDAVPHAKAGFAQQAPSAELTTQFSATASAQLQDLAAHYPQLQQLIEQVLAQDPRPAYQRQQASERIYGVHLYDLNIQWQVQGQQNLVINITKVF